MLRLEEMVKQLRARGDDHHHQRRWRRRRLRRRRQQQPRPDQHPPGAPRGTERTNDEIAQELRRQLAGLPGVIVRANPAGGNFQLFRMLGGGDNDARLALEIRGDDLDDARRIAQEARTVMEGTPGLPTSASAAKRAVLKSPFGSIDRRRPCWNDPQAVATTIQTNVAGTTAAQFRERGNEYPIIVRLREADREEISDIGDVLLSTPAGQVVPAEPAGGRPRSGTGADRPEEHGADHARQRRHRNQPERGDYGGPSDLNQVRVPPDFAVGFGAEVEEQARASGSSCWCWCSRCCSSTR